MAQFGGMMPNWLRTASLIRRFSRLRSTDFPKLRGTVKPNRAGIAAAPSRKQNAAKKRLVMRTPVS
jgi:hypothetical protein